MTRKAQPSTAAGVYPGAVELSRGVDSASSLADAVDLEDVVVRALGALLHRPGVRRAGLALTEGGGRRLRFTARARGESGAPEWCLIDAYEDVPLTSVVSTGRAILGGLDDLDRRFSGLASHQRAQGIVALAAVPLPGTGSPCGGLICFYAEPPDFTGAERRALDEVAAEVATALVRVRAVAPRSERTWDDEARAEEVRVGAVVVEADPRAVGEARRFLRGLLGGWDLDADVSDTAVLLLSELVTNALVHTDAPAEVRAVLGSGELTVTVRDHGRPHGEAVVQPHHEDDPLRVHGRGLQLVDALADRWGAERDAGGTSVWFALSA